VTFLVVALGSGLAMAGAVLTRSTSEPADRKWSTTAGQTM
jgi:hypothetical protein